MKNEIHEISKHNIIKRNQSDRGHYYINSDNHRKKREFTFLFQLYFVFT